MACVHSELPEHPHIDRRCRCNHAGRRQAFLLAAMVVQSRLIIVSQKYLLTHGNAALFEHLKIGNNPERDAVDQRAIKVKKKSFHELDDTCGPLTPKKHLPTPLRLIQCPTYGKADQSHRGT